MHFHPRRLGAGGRIVLLSVVAASLIAACSASATSAPADESGQRAAASMAPAAPNPAREGAKGIVDQPGDGTGGEPGQPPSNWTVGRLIIRTGSVTLEVASIDAALAKAQEIVAAAGGYVASGKRSGDAERATATITYRVPVERFDSTLSSVRGIGAKLLGEEIGSEEVTSQVVDLGARIANLRASETALQKIMDQATKIPDILAVQQQLATTREEIERLVAAKQGLEQQAAMSTLTVTFTLPPAVAVDTVASGWSPASIVDNAVATLVGFGQGIAEAAIWLAIVVLPIALTIAIPLLVLFFLVRRFMRRRPRPTTPAGPPAGSGTGPQAGSALWPAG